MSQSRRGEQTWIDAAADRFERQWNWGPDRPRIEDRLAAADPNRRARLLEELVRVECELRRAGGEQPTPVGYLVRFPDDCPAVNAAFLGEDASSPARRPVSAAESLLFGLLALQNRFIDRDGLLAAFDAWVSDKTKPLGKRKGPARVPWCQRLAFSALNRFRTPSGPKRAETGAKSQVFAQHATCPKMT